jgi:hypothetical protein
MAIWAAHLSTLSKDAGAKFRKLVKEQMFSIIWDNLNITFCVESQQLNLGNHFDNGATATATPLYNPFIGSTKTHGTLPLDMKPLHTTTFPVLVIFETHLVDGNCQW